MLASACAFGMTERAHADNFGTEANFARALQYSIYFYDANMCGTEVSENNRYTWRGNCHTYDAQVPLNSAATNLSDSFLTENAKYLDPDGDGYIMFPVGFTMPVTT